MFIIGSSDFHEDYGMAIFPSIFYQLSNYIKNIKQSLRDLKTKKLSPFTICSSLACRLHQVILSFIGSISSRLVLKIFLIKKSTKGPGLSLGTQTFEAPSEKLRSPPIVSESKFTNDLVNKISQKYNLLKYGPNRLMSINKVPRSSKKKSSIH